MPARLLLTSLSAGFLVTLSLADEIALNPLLVEAPFYAPQDTLPELATGQVRVIKREQFLAHQRTLADVLDQVPEVQVQRSGEHGSFSSISVRGAPSRQTLVFIDGIQVASAENGVVNLSQFGLYNVEAIEIYSTAPPAQMAQASMGGAINIITRNNQAQQGRLNLGVASFGQRMLDGQWQSQQGAWRWRASGFAQQARNDFSYLFDAGTANNPDNWQQVRRNNAGYQSAGFTLGSDYRQHNQRWSASYTQDHSHKDLPTWHNRDISDTFYRQQQRRADLQWALVEQGPLSGSVRGFWQQTNGRLQDLTGAISFRGNDTRDQSLVQGVNGTLAASLGDHYLTQVLELRRETFELNNLDSQQGLAHQRSSLALSLTDEWMPLAAHDWLLAGNLRLLLAQDQDLNGSGQGESSLQNDANQQGDISQRSLTGQLGSRWQSQNGYVFKSNLSYFERLPSLFELYGNQGTFRGNPDLAVEQSKAFDLSLGQEQPSLDWQLAYFWRFSENAIAPEYNSQGIGRYVNIGDAWFQGLEWHLKLPFVALGQDWRFSHSGSAQRSWVASPFRAYHGKQVPGYYPLSQSTELMWLKGATSLSAQWQRSQGLYFDRANSTQAPVKEYLNLAMRHRFSTGSRPLKHQLEGGVINLLNSPAMDFNRSPLPGRSFSLNYQLIF